jgi:hypothetical protein
VFDSYDAAYELVERYYADVCCSDDCEHYRIVDDGEQLPGSRHSHGKRHRHLYTRAGCPGESIKAGCRCNP